MTFSAPAASPATTTSDGVPPQSSSTICVASSSPGSMKFRIDAALEAVARIGVDAERAAGVGDVERLPQRQFDQHVGGGLVAAGLLAAHDAGDRFHAVVVGDHAHVRRRACRSCRRAPAPSRRPCARRTTRLPFTFLASKTCSGRPRSKVMIVGDVDQRVDRAQADGLQPLLQPFRRRAVLDAAHQPQRERRAQRTASRRSRASPMTGQGNRP